MSILRKEGKTVVIYSNNSAIKTIIHIIGFVYINIYFY
jgi:hypothetical protein